MATVTQWTFDRWLDDNDDQWMPYDYFITVAHYLVSESKDFYFTSESKDFYFTSENI